MEWSLDLVVGDTSSMKSSVQVFNAVSKARQRLDMLNRTLVRLTPELFIPASSTIVRSHRLGHSLFNDINKLERLH